MLKTTLKLMTNKKNIRMHKKANYYERKMKSLFIIYEYFESILVPEDNGKQNPKNLIQRKIKNILLAVMALN